MTALTIGVPVFNGGIYLDRALTSLRNQTFTDWQMLIADNASTDDTAMIAKRHAMADGRIRIVQRPENIGAAGNFIALTEGVDTQYFMWAASDDEWSADLIERAMVSLVANPSAGLASGSVVHIDRDGTAIRTIPSFTQFSNRSALVRLTRFTAMREARGKANLIYSVFRTEVLKGACETGLQSMTEWGGDYGLVAAALARAAHVATDAAMFKRVTLESDVLATAAFAKGDYASQQFGGAFPPSLLRQFTETMTRGIPDAGHRRAIAAVLFARRWAGLQWEAGQRFRNLRKRLSASSR